MTIQVSSIRWAAVQEALREAVGRVTALLRSDLDPNAPAIGEWSLAEVAMHLSQAWLIVPDLARGDLSRTYEVVPDMEGIAGANFIRDVWDLGGATKLGVRSDPERSLRVLADRIEGRAAEFFAEQAGRSPDEACPWLVEGVVVPRPVLTAHLLNETLVHGRDIARAGRRPWPIERAHAAMVFGDFIVEIMKALPPRAMVDQKRAKGVRAVFDLRLRGGDSWRWCFDDGELRIDPEPRPRIDCHISADPLTLVLVAYGRKSQWPAIAKGQLVAWGRRPWLGPRLRALMRNP